MGGSALSVISKRIDADQYYDLGSRIMTLYKDRVNTSFFKIIPSYHSKKTFGDMDIVYATSDIDTLVKILSEEFTITEVVRNGPVTSVGIIIGYHEVFQIDFVRVSEEEFDFAYNYFSWNDIGNLIGRIARRIGLKFGHKGLFYVQRAEEGERVLKEHLLTRDFSTALEHLGLCSTRWKWGFHTPSEIYIYVLSSKFYDFSSFDLKERNKKARDRGKKRPMYNGFLKYAAEHKAESNPDLLEKSEYLTYHFDRFPLFERAYIDTHAEYTKQLDVSKKVNGHRVMELTGLSGKLLGAFMRILQDQPWMQNSILTLDQDSVDCLIKHCYDQHMHLLSSNRE